MDIVELKRNIDPGFQHFERWEFEIGDDLPWLTSKTDRARWPLDTTTTIWQGPWRMLLPLMRRDDVTEIILRNGKVKVETRGDTIPTTINFLGNDIPGYTEKFGKPGLGDFYRGLQYIHGAMTGHQLWGDPSFGCNEQGDVGVEGNLEDGSRLMALLPPVSANRAPFMNIRRFRSDKMEREDFIQCGSLTAEALDTIQLAVHAHASILVAGITGSGKTTLLEYILRCCIPEHEFIFTVEDTPELRVEDHPGWCGFVTRERPSDARGDFQEMTLVDGLVKSLRAKPDWIVPGEIRDSVDPKNSPAAVFLSALQTGHAGGCTLHANDAYGAMVRLEAMIRDARPSSKDESIRMNVGNAINLIINPRRVWEEHVLPNGKRVRKKRMLVDSITEVLGSDGTIYFMNPLFAVKSRLHRVETEVGPKEVSRFHLEQVGIPFFGLELKSKGFEEMPDWWMDARIEHVGKIPKVGRVATRIELLSMAG